MERAHIGADRMKYRSPYVTDDTALTDVAIDDRGFLKTLDVLDIFKVDSCDSAGETFLLGTDHTIDRHGSVYVTADELRKIGQELIAMAGDK
jgi:hypothetical protein